eukprot:4832418-Pleurochrysis_carterae.AAC.2
MSFASVGVAVSFAHTPGQARRLDHHRKRAHYPNLRTSGRASVPGDGKHLEQHYIAFKPVARQEIRGCLRNREEHANEVADWAKQYIPPTAVIACLGDTHGWHRHAQDMLVSTGLVRHIYIP